MKIKLCESKWNFKIGDNSVKLRNAINEGNIPDVKKYAIEVCKEIQTHYNEDDYEYSELDDIIEELELLENSEEEAAEFDYEDSLEERVDYVLGELYDFCDGERIWLSIDEGEF